MKWHEEKKMTPGEFEQVCVDLVERCFPNDSYRIAFHPRRTYKDGVTKIMDIEIAERKQGGKSYVIDCKHFQVVALNEHEIDSTLEYKRRSKASAAIMLISGASEKFTPNFESYANSKGVHVIQVSTLNAALVNRIRNITVKRELRRIVSR